MVRQPWEIVWRLERAIRIVDVKSKIILERDALDSAELSALFDRLYQFEEGSLALASYDNIDVTRIERRVSVQGGKIAAPDDRNPRMLGAKFSTDWNRSLHLGTRHHGHGKHDAPRFVAYAIECLPRTRARVPVDDCDLFFAFESRSQRKNRQWETAVLRFCRSGMKQDNHRREKFPTRIQKCDGGLRC